MVLQISPASIAITSLALESLLFGVFCVLSASSLYLLFVREALSDRPKNSKLAALTTPLIFANVLISAAVTTHWVCSLVRAFQAFVRDNGGKTPREYYTDLSETMFLVNTALVISTLIIGDSVMIYRLRTVFKYNRSTMVFPLCCLFGFIACGIGTVFQFSKLSPNHNVFLASIGTVFTFITNVFCSTFIAWKIYRVNSATSSSSGRNLGSVTGIIVESAALYTSWTIMFMASYLAGSQLEFLFIDTISVIAGISFMLINVRIGLGWAQNLKTQGTSQSVSLAFRPTPVSGVRTVDERSRSSHYQMHSLAVHIERTTIKDTEDGHELDDHLPSRPKEFDAMSDSSVDRSTTTTKGIPERHGYL